MDEAFSSEIELHWVRVGAAALDLGTLSTRERERMDAFRDETARRVYATGRTALRALLGARLGRGPAEVEIGRAAGGKPAVAGCEFNLSHAGEWVCIALGDLALGVDVERIERDWVRLSPRVFSDRERDRVDGRPVEATAVWSAKEALLKAAGTGIRRTLRELCVAEVERDTWREVEAGWHARLLVAPMGYRAAVVAARPAGLRVAREWSGQ